jgi:putative nucleotidyltransferase with HDIG domain
VGNDPGREINTNIRRWFNQYVQAFKNGDRILERGIALKEKHSINVSTEIVSLGGKVGLTEKDLQLAETIGLLHDLGRFEQFASYRTFVDSRSVNHAKLGANILRKAGILEGYDARTQHLILRAVLYHNLPALPRREKNSILFFSKLLRDADKLDILRVVTEYYLREDFERDDVLDSGYPDTPGISGQVYRNLVQRRLVRIHHVKNLNDFKLFRLGWVYDINFTPTVERMVERGYLEMIRNTLPKSSQIQSIFDSVHCYIHQRRSRMETACGSSDI